MQPPTFENLTGALMSGVALGTVCFLAIVTTNNDVRNVLIGLLGGVIIAGNGFFLRAKVQAPTSQTPPDPPVVPHG